MKKENAEYFLNSDLQGWEIDSSSIFQMKNTAGTVETWALEGSSLRKAISTGTLKEECQNYSAEYSTDRLQSQINGWNFTQRISSGPFDQTLTLNLIDFRVIYEPETGITQPISIPGGELITTASKVDSVEIEGHAWKEVLKIFANTNSISIRSIWIAKHYGLIRFELSSGEVWERL